jgi:hypothetical protein
MDDEMDEEDQDTQAQIDEALNAIDPTGELAAKNKAEVLARAIIDADAFAAGMYHGGHTGQEIMTFANRMYMIGYLIHTNNVMKALKHKPADVQDDHYGDIWSYH